MYSSNASISWRVSSPRPPSGPGPTRPRRVGVTLRRLPWLGVTLRPVRLVTDGDTLRDRLRRLSVEGLSCGSGAPLRPVGSDLGLPTQVQDFLALLPDLVIALLQSWISLECTVTPKLNLRLIASRFRGFHHATYVTSPNRHLLGLRRQRSSNDGWLLCLRGYRGRRLS